MEITFYIASVVAIVSTVMVITRLNAVHALLYLIVSFLAIAVIFFIIGAPFIAALEVIIYAGAIMVLFVFVIMMLNLGKESENQEKIWLSGKTWIGPLILSIILLAEFIFILSSGMNHKFFAGIIEPKEIGLSLFTTYLLGVELSGILLMSGIIGAYHLGRRKKKFIHRFLKEEINNE